jgi:hypothetical protein
MIQGHGEAATGRRGGNLTRRPGDVVLRGHIKFGMAFDCGQGREPLRQTQGLEVIERRVGKPIDKPPLLLDK